MNNPVLFEFFPKSVKFPSIVLLLTSIRPEGFLVTVIFSVSLFQSPFLFASTEFLSVKTIGHSSFSKTSIVRGII